MSTSYSEAQIQIQSSCPPPTKERFKGKIIHTSEFVNAKKNAGKKVVIIGAGTSAHDVAADYVKDGAGEVVC